MSWWVAALIGVGGILLFNAVLIAALEIGPYLLDKPPQQSVRPNIRIVPSPWTEG